jgi:hypothetical protein
VLILYDHNGVQTRIRITLIPLKQHGTSSVMRRADVAGSTRRAQAFSSWREPQRHLPPEHQLARQKKIIDTSRTKRTALLKILFVRV